MPRRITVGGRKGEKAGKFLFISSLRGAKNNFCEAAQDKGDEGNVAATPATGSRPKRVTRGAEGPDKREEEERNAPGPLQVLAKVTKGKGGAKGKGKAWVAAGAWDEEDASMTMSSEEVLHCEILTRKLVTKKVELEVLMREIEVLEEMMEM